MAQNAVKSEQVQLVICIPKYNLHKLIVRTLPTCLPFISIQLRDDSDITSQIYITRYSSRSKRSVPTFNSNLRNHSINACLKYRPVDRLLQTFKRVRSFSKRPCKFKPSIFLLPVFAALMCLVPTKSVVIAPRSLLASVSSPCSAFYINAPLFLNGQGNTYLHPDPARHPPPQSHPFFGSDVSSGLLWLMLMLESFPPCPTNINIHFLL